MEAKLFEVRDKGTFIPMLAVKLEPGCEEDRYLLARAGYGRSPEVQAEYIVLWSLEGGEMCYDPRAWGSNHTRRTAHDHVIEHWEQYPSGSVIDVQYLLGETETPKQSERLRI